MKGLDEEWSSVANSFEEFVRSKSTTESDVLRMISILIFVVHFHKRIPVQPGFHTNAVLVAFEFAARLLQICASANDVFSTALLPALLTFVEWYVYSPDVITEKVEASVVINQDEGESISRATLTFWRSCQNFLSTTLSGKNMQGHDGILSSCRNYGELVDRVALWEDRVLQLYAPFDPVHRC